MLPSKKSDMCPTCCTQSWNTSILPILLQALSIKIGLSENFWGFVKCVIEKGSTVLLTFSQNHWTLFFIKMFSAHLPCKKFTIPQGIPSFIQLSFPLDQSTPSYGKVMVTEVIQRIKPFGSPCPLDKISIVSFTRCPYLKAFWQRLFALFGNRDGFHLSGRINA